MGTAKKNKNNSNNNESFEKFKSNLSSDKIAQAYIFFGEESYLREYYLEELRKKLIPESFSEFNYHRLEGQDLTIQELTEAVESMPMMTDRTLVVATDCDLFKLNEEQRGQMIALLEDLPPYVCLVFVYSRISYEPNRAFKKLCKALADHVETVEFCPQDSGKLVDWIGRRFRSLGKEIDRDTSEYLIFLCGSLMDGLIPEIEKIAMYARDSRITRKDIDAVAIPILSAEVFRLSDAVVAGNYDRAASILGDLLKMEMEPILILSALGSQMRRIYTACLAIESGKDRYWLKNLWGYKSDYPVRLLLDAAKKTNKNWCSDAVKMCQTLDKRLKSENGIDAVNELKLLLVRLAGSR